MDDPQASMIGHVADGMNAFGLLTASSIQWVGKYPIVGLRLYYLFSNCLLQDVGDILLVVGRPRYSLSVHRSSPETNNLT